MGVNFQGVEKTIPISWGTCWSPSGSEHFPWWEHIVAATDWLITLSIGMATGVYAIALLVVLIFTIICMPVSGWLSSFVGMSTKVGRIILLLSVGIQAIATAIYGIGLFCSPQAESEKEVLMALAAGVAVVGWLLLGKSLLKRTGALTLETFYIIVCCILSLIMLLLYAEVNESLFKAEEGFYWGIRIIGFVTGQQEAAKEVIWYLNLWAKIKYVALVLAHPCQQSTIPYITLSYLRLGFNFFLFWVMGVVFTGDLSGRSRRSSFSGSVNGSKKTLISIT